MQAATSSSTLLGAWDSINNSGGLSGWACDKAGPSKAIKLSLYIDGVGVTSFDKNLFMGLMSDPNIIDDVDLIAKYCADEFKALREAAGVPVSDLPDFGARPARNGNGSGAKAAETATPMEHPVPAT